MISYVNVKSLQQSSLMQLEITTYAHFAAFKQSDPSIHELKHSWRSKSHRSYVCVDAIILVVDRDQLFK